MIEFQNYHVDRYERLKDGITADKSALNAARKALKMSASKDTDTRVEELQWKIEDAESTMQLYEKLLRWIEQQRITMATEQVGPSHSDESDDRPKSIPTPTSAGQRKKNEKTCAPLGPIRLAVSQKSPTKRRGLRSTK